MSVTRNSVTRIDSKQWRIDEETGFLNVRVFPTRAGVFKYRRADGSIVRELRPPEEVFDPKSLATLNNKPFTNDHPPGNLSPETVMQYKTGLMGNDHRRSDAVEWHTEASATIEDPNHVKDVTDRGKVENSCGYRCDMEKTSGVHPDFGEYDEIQRNIRYNHISSVWRGRAGHGARVTQDCERYDAYEITDEDDLNESPNNKTEELPEMVKIKIDGHEVEVSEAAKVAYEAEKVKIDNDLKAEKTRADEAVKALDSAKTEATQAKADLDTANDKIKELESIDLDARADERAALVAQAQAVLGKEYKAKGRADAQIREDIVLKLSPSAKNRLDSIEEGERSKYVQWRFDDLMADESTPKPKPKNNVMDAYDEAPPPQEWAERHDLMD